MSRSAFSLVELLCVISLIGILVAMLLPAIQSVRESARKLGCQNNLRQLSLAAQNYETAQNALPTGTLGFPGTIRIRLAEFERARTDPGFAFYLLKNQNTSWIVQILPFIEQRDLADQLPLICFDLNRTYEQERLRTGGPSKLSDLNEVAHVMAQGISLLYCPSDNLANDERLISGKAGGQPAYLTDVKLDVFLWFQDLIPMAGTNYAGCSGAYSGGEVPDPEMERFDGIFGSRTQKRTADIRDGSSNSIVFGECLGLISGNERTSINPWFFSTLCRGRSDMEWQQTYSVRSPGLELLGDNWFAHQSGFASKHPTTVNFARLDGSVTSLTRAIQWPELYSLCGIDDGELSLEQ